jgi:hypothetical protein
VLSASCSGFAHVAISSSCRSNGSGRAQTLADWKCRRNEIKAEIELYEITGNALSIDDIKNVMEDETNSSPCYVEYDDELMEMVI